ncbi:pantoate kinase [Methanospirillum lacunae]|uniref:Pantoate kinase n=1 Tax=Methanospirillum lacunae TaxID=668570 RepID=A0A2V2NFG2_9EURY|nr:pantoate kinase [Methanospirillum lacunae]PWR74053.1 GHMP kinase [Methanospirillum lacunae]
MSPSQVTVFCPGHISGYFKPVITGDPKTSGSCGGGIVINSGVTVVATRAEETTIQVLKTSRDTSQVVSDNSPVIKHLMQNLGLTASIKTFCTLPLSSGYGLSAAALLATVHAVNQLFDLGLSPEKCAMQAHQVEVAFRTGLGDVAACQGGGWVVRKGPGIMAEILRYKDDQTIHAITLSPLKTESVLSSPEMMNRITDAFPKTDPDTLIGFFACSRSFAEASGLISPDIEKVLIDCDANNIPVSMTMLGNGIFALGERAKDLLNRYGETYSLQISHTGPRIMEVLP